MFTLYFEFQDLEVSQPMIESQVACGILSPSASSSEVAVRQCNYHPSSENCKQPQTASAEAAVVKHKNYTADVVNNEQPQVETASESSKGRGDGGDGTPCSSCEEPCKCPECTGCCCFEEAAAAAAAEGVSAGKYIHHMQGLVTGVPQQRQETLDLPYLTLLCDNLKNRMFLQNFFS
jgi:hypothetical protein